MKYRREIDGLRAVAVLPVIFFHAGFDAFSGGFVGVDIFFVISGYLITTIILAEKEKGTFSLVHFYDRRARRILPALFFVMLCCLPFAWLWLLPKHLDEFSQSLIAVSCFSSNILFWQESGYFATVAELKPLLHTWSLAVEEQYYILFPLFLMFMWKLRKRWIFGSLLAIAAGSLALAQWGAYQSPTATFFLLPARCWELAIGALIAFYFLYKKTHTDFATSNRAVNELFSFAGMALICYSIFAFDKATPFPGIYALLPTLGTGLLVIFTSPRTLVGRFLGTKIMVGIGLISYSTYLWHQPIFVFARHRSIAEPGTLLLLFFSALSIGLAYLSWRFVELPFRDRELFTRKKIFIFALIGSMLFIAVGATGHINKGFSQRLPQDHKKVLKNLKKGRRERQKLIRNGECHYNEKSAVNFDDFLQNWNCYDDSTAANYKKIPVAITGDSHAADKVISLKKQGYLPLQITGAGCSLDPSFMTDQCKQIYEKLAEVLRDNPDIQYLGLSNRFRKHELNIPSLKRTLDFWDGYGKQLIIFTSMPEFNSLEKRILFNDTSGPNLKYVSLFERDEIVDYLRQRGVTVLSSSKLFCGDGDSCPMVLDSKPLLADDTHLSVAGASLFGSRLIKTEPFKSVCKDAQ